MKCLYCERTQFALLCRVTDHLGHVPGEFEFFRCSGCGSWQLDPLPGPEDIAGSYPTAYSFKPPARGIRAAVARIERALYYRPILRYNVQAVRRFCDSDGEKLLDIGCGSGMQMAAFRDAGYKVAGLDMSEEDVRFAAEELGLDARQGFVGEGLPFPRENFAIVTMFNLLEHVLDPVGVLRWAADLLRPGGYMAVEVPNTLSYQWALLRSLWAVVREAPRHIGIPSPNGVAAAFGRAGLAFVGSVGSAPSVQAGALAVSLVPVATHALAGSGRLKSLGSRALGGLCYSAALPAACLLRRPAWSATVIYFARKPTGR